MSGGRASAAGPSSWRKRLRRLDARGAFDKKGHGDVPIWAMMSEDILTLDGLADASIPTEGYVDDGEAH